MSPEALWNEFKARFSYMVSGVARYDSIRNDTRSIRVHMKDGEKFIFTYPRNGHYTLITENFGGK